MTRTDLIKRAIESAKCRQYKVRVRDSYSIDHQRKAENQTELMNITIEALEKQIPIEHHHTVVNHINDEIRTSICPSCLSMIHTHKADFPKFCNECGQAIDWSEEE